MRVAVRGLPTFSADVSTNFIHSPEPTRDNMRETREVLSQIPRFHSAPTPLTSQVCLIFISCLTKYFFIKCKKIIKKKYYDVLGSWCAPLRFYWAPSRAFVCSSE